MTVRDIDRGFKRRLEELAKSALISVGIHEAEGSGPEGDGSVTIADVGVFHEFGTSRIPARSFIRAWFDESASENHKLMQDMMGAVAGGKLTLGVGAERFGMRMAGDVKKRIIAGLEPELSDVTVERKGSSTPLIDQGQLVGAITYKATT